jgi:outer membrane protein assembly factor BamB
MKKMKIINLIMLCPIAFLVASCEKEVKIDSDTLPRIVWKVQLGPQIFDNLAFDPVIYKDKLVMGYQLSSGSEGYFIYNKNNGVVLKDISNEASFDPSVSVVHNNLYLSKAGSNIRSINLDNYSISTTPILNGGLTNSRLIVNDGKFFITRSGRENYTPNQNEFDILTCDIMNNLKIETIINRSFNRDTNVFGSDSGIPIVNQNSKGDRIVYFGSSLSYWKDFKPYIYRVEAYNLTTKKTVWQTPIFELEGEDIGNPGSTTFSIFEDMFIVGLGNTEIRAYNIANGMVVWTRKLNGLGRSILHNGKITLINMQGDMYLIDARSGAIIKKSSVGPANVFNISLHKGVLYFSTVLNKLFAVNADTHEILWETKPPNSCSYCNYGFKYTIVDPETDRLYISDGREVICYQLR